MKFTFARLTLSALALVAGITSLAAETNSILSISVPFSFTATGTKMPAGDYVVESSSVNGTMILHSLSGKNSVIMLAGPLAAVPSSHGPSLTFDRRGGESVLTGITTGSATVRIFR